MVLNSFCVIVTKDGLRVHWKKPERLNDAVKTYRRLSRQYDSQEPVLLKFDDTEVVQESNSNYTQYFSDEWIEERIRMWQGRMELVTHMVVNIGWMQDDGKGIQIELMHSSRA